MLELRIITAVILGAIVIGIVLSGNQHLFLLFLAACVLTGSWEWAGLCRCRNSSVRIAYALVMSAVFLSLALLLPDEFVSWIIVPGIIWWCFALFLIVRYQCDRRGFFCPNQCKYLMGIMVLIPALFSLYHLYGSDRGQLLILTMFILIWLIDSTAYFAGRAIGKIYLADRVSPGKTLEGFIASLVAAIGVAVLYGYWSSYSSLHFIFLIILFLLTALFSVIGDLFISVLKRESNLKDSGKLLPGHGGVLDRIDSLTASAPVFVLGMLFIEGRT